MPRSRASAKKAGTAFERLVADYLKEQLCAPEIDRKVRRGRFDEGDIANVRTIRGADVVVECKDVSRDALPKWVDEARIEAGNADAAFGVVAHKRRGTTDPGEQFVTMTLRDFALLLEGGPDTRPVVVIDPMKEERHA